MEKKIVVVGSANVDMVVKTDKFPEAGETVLGGEFFKFPGGKGANQAVAAARLGGNVTFICKIGDDDFGRDLIELYKKEGINTDYILTDQHNPTGVAMITVDKAGENKIVVAPGANAGFTVEDVETFQKPVSEADIVVLQLEIPVEIIGQVIKQANQHGIKVILNPAPAQPLPEAFYKDLFLISPNETEVKSLTGIAVDGRESALKAAKRFRASEVKNVVITLGEKGAFVYTDDFTGLISTPRVEAKDSTAAGDVFNGALAVALMQKKSWEKAVRFACRAAALSVTKNGAQSSAPTVVELRSFNQSLAENQ